MKTPVPATPVFRDAAGNPYDARALARNSRVLPWARHATRVVHQQQPNHAPMPLDGFRYLMNLDELAFRSWRNGR